MEGGAYNFPPPLIKTLFQRCGIKAMPMVTLKQGCAQAIKSFLSERQLVAGIRIELRFTGCCDPSLGLCMDDPDKSDLTCETEGLTFILSTETYKTVGDIVIDYLNDGLKKGFILTSSIPLSEWQGFSPCGIGLKPDSHKESK